jgi:hypothetical protein
MSFVDPAWVRSEEIVDEWIYQFCWSKIGAAAAQTLLDYRNAGGPVDFILIGKGNYDIITISRSGCDLKTFLWR